MNGAFKYLDCILGPLLSGYIIKRFIHTRKVHFICLVHYVILSLKIILIILAGHDRHIIA